MERERRDAGSSSPGSGDAAVQRSPGKTTLTHALATQGPLVQAKGEADGPAVQSAAAHGVSGSPGALPHKERIQQLFGRHDVSGIGAHVGGAAAEATGAMGASAYATGNQVAFGASPDLHTAAHEAAHVVQQRGGVQLAGGVGKSGDAYEQHADRVADLVVSGQSAEHVLDQMAGGGGGGGRGVQRSVQLLGGDIKSTKTLARFGGATDSTVEAELTKRDQPNGRPGQIKQVTRDQNHNNTRKVGLENALARALLANPGLYAKPVQHVSTSILAYIEQKCEGVAERINAQLAKLEPENKKFFGQVKGSEFVTSIRAALGGGGTITNQVLAHATFITNIYATDFRELEIDKLVARANTPTHLKDGETRVPLGVGGSMSYSEAHDSARLDPQDKDSVYRQKHRKDVPMVDKVSGTEPRPLVAPDAKSTIPPRPDMAQQPPALDAKEDAAKLPEDMHQTHERGTDRWTANEANAFVQDARLVLDMPLSGAGASGNAAELLNCAQIFGVPSGQPMMEYGLAVLGFLMGGGAHSFHEIMVIARQAGIDYEPGQYRKVFPESFLKSAAYHELATAYPDLLDPAVKEHAEEDVASESVAVSEPSVMPVTPLAEASSSAAPKYRLPGARGIVTLEEGNPSAWPATVQAFLARELGVGPELVEIDPLSGGRTGTPVYLVKVEGKALGVFKVFGDMAEAETEVKMLRLLAAEKCPAVAERGVTRVGDGAGGEKAAMFMDTAPGDSVDAMIKVLPESGETRQTALARIKTAACAVARSMAKFHDAFQQTDKGTSKMDEPTKKFEMSVLSRTPEKVEDPGGKLEKLRAANRLTATEYGLVKGKLTDVFESYRSAELPATAAHGDANAGNFLYNEEDGGVQMIDVGTMDLSLARNEKGKKTGASDVGRYLQSLLSSHPGKLQADEHAAIKDAFLEAYFEEVPQPEAPSTGGKKPPKPPKKMARDPAQYTGAITFYRAWMEIVALETSSAEPPTLIRDAKVRLGEVLGVSLPAE